MAAVAVGALVLAGGAALAMGVSLEPELAPLQAGGARQGVAGLRDAHKADLQRAASAPLVLGVKRRKLESIAECESHGDPRAVSSDKTYRGKYQFDKGTWASQGGTGDPAKAPELEQDMRAAILYKAAGSSPWPNCG